MNNTSRFQLYLPGRESSNNNGLAIVSADLRPILTTFSLFESENGNLNLKLEKQLPTKDFGSFSEMFNDFLSKNSLEKPDRLALGVPGPIIDGKSEPASLPWKLDANEIKNQTSVNKVYLINDLECTAYALSSLSENSISPIHQSPTISKGNVAILAPGNGLGEAGLFFDGVFLRPFATEGGHSEFSPRTDVEVEFYQFLKAIYGIVSWESVLSKNGLFNIYRFLRDVKRHPEPEWLTKKFAEGDFIEVLCRAALDEKEGICKITLDTFIEFLARESNNLVLKLKATGGLLISGEIPVLIKDYLDTNTFYKKFIISDKMENLLRDIPIDFLLDERTIAIGSAYYGAFYEA